MRRSARRRARPWTRCGANSASPERTGRKQNAGGTMGGTNVPGRAATIVRTGLALAAAGPASAQDYPNRPIRFLVGFAAGGSSDIVARVIGQKMSDILGVAIPVENRTG